MANDNLAALEYLLDLTDESDWPLIHNTVRNDVAAGKLSAADERAYAAMVDKKLGERDEILFGALND